METDKVGKEEITSAPMEEIPAGQDNVNRKAPKSSRKAPQDSLK